MKLTVRLHLLLLIAALVAVSACSVFAQGDGASRGELLRVDLERTDEMIDRAAEATRTCDNPAASLALDRARQLLAQAKERFDANQYDMSRRLMILSRDQVKLAMAACRLLEEQEGNVQRRLERAQDLLDKAGEQVAGLGQGPVVTLYESARSNLTRAWEFYYNREYRPALKLAEQVENAARKILGLSGSPAQDENMQRRFDNAEQAVEQARQAVVGCTDQNAIKLLEQAEKALLLARELDEQGRYGGATMAANNARELANRATRHCQGGDRLTVRLDALQARADQLWEQSLGFEDAKRKFVQNLLEQVFSQLTLAREQLAAGEVGRTEAALQAAGLLLRQAEAAAK
uniref:Filamin-A-interacting protein 1 isoform X2 n=1 Tax=uncultured bacterium pAW1 TaxID=1781155 RepID=A0A1C9U4P4_9BACT|nr:filamin-A-interacting protein 1 isoform X2 [uncultured bacterium pAW1]